jgi:hypothetical protein
MLSATKAAPLVSGLSGLVGALLLLIGLPTAYLRVSVVNTTGFTNRMEAVRKQPDAQELVADVIVSRIEEQQDPDLVAKRPLMVHAVAAVLGSDAVGPIYRRAVGRLHRELLTPGDTPLLLNLSDLGVLVIDTVKAQAPALAAKIPINLRSAFVELGPRGRSRIFLLAQKLRPVAPLLPPVGYRRWAWCCSVRRSRPRKTGAGRCSWSGSRSAWSGS